MRLHFVFLIILFLASCVTGQKNFNSKLTKKKAVLVGDHVSRLALNLLRESPLFLQKYSKDKNIDLSDAVDCRIVTRIESLTFNCRGVQNNITGYQVLLPLKKVRPSADFSSYFIDDEKFSKDFFNYLSQLKSRQSSDGIFVSHFNNCKKMTDSLHTNCIESYSFNFGENIDSVDLACNRKKGKYRCIWSLPNHLANESH